MKIVTFTGVEVIFIVMMTFFAFYLYLIGCDFLLPKTHHDLPPKDVRL